jgi:hypothetical protein
MELSDAYREELAGLREMFESRFDDLESGRVQAIDGEEAFRMLMAESAEARKKSRLTARLPE